MYMLLQLTFGFRVCHKGLFSFITWLVCLVIIVIKLYLNQNNQFFVSIGKGQTTLSLCLTVKLNKWKTCQIRVL